MVALYAQCYPESEAAMHGNNSEVLSKFFRRHIKSTRNKIHSFMFSICKSRHQKDIIMKLGQNIK
jgi:hypothetical protein